ASRVDLEEVPSHEVGAVFKVNALLSVKVRQALGAGQFPLVMAGNCNSCLGTLAGLAGADIGVTWFDGHGDFHTPETTETGFFDGFPLNITVGRSWTTLAKTIPGFIPVSESNVILAGVRDLDVPEEQLVRKSTMNICDYEDIRSGSVARLIPHLDSIAGRTSSVYVHVDLDVLDPEIAPANEHSPPGGLRPQELDAALSLIGQRLQVKAATLAGYDPAVDPHQKGLAAGLAVIKKLASLG
ncbi:MAG: hypothetical protein GTN78_06700, partial [Gemmatimonadales bacterium]|nr:hypothetical protein [Gemmatimonadales bacterium]